jgi:hypothetical protein
MAGGRDVRLQGQQRGWRTTGVVVVTPRLDAHACPKDALASLSRQRWQAARHLRSLKSVMPMDHLRCLTPHRARHAFSLQLFA